MRKFLLCAAMCVAPFAAASAADMPFKSPPPAPPPVLSWTGWYGGVSGGWIESQKGAKETNRDGDCGSFQSCARAEGVFDALAGDQPFKSQSGMWGLTLGANYQVDRTFVIGIESDISYVKLHGSATDTGLYENGPTYSQTTSSSSGMDWFATVRARAGLLLTPSTLAFVTGGLAVGGVHASLDVNGSYSLLTPVTFFGFPTPVGQLLEHPWTSNASVNKTKVGWTAGGGLEQKVSANWSVKGEALYYDLGSVSVTNDMGAVLQASGTGFPFDSFVTKTNSYKFNGIIARAGANYKF